MAREQAQPTRTRKIAAITAGALVIGLGAVYTLASWNDSEWVWGSADGNPGIGTQTFNVEQNTTVPFDNSEINWVNEEENPGGALIFPVEALALTPGDTIYAPVSLRTVEGSIAGSLELQGAVAAEGRGDDPNPRNDHELWNAVQVQVWTHSGETPQECSATGVQTGWDDQIITASGLGQAASGPQPLAATADADTPGIPQNYCFAITLPENPAGVQDVKTLQGMQIAPAWEFKAESE